MNRLRRTGHLLEEEHRSLSTIIRIHYDLARGHSNTWSHGKDEGNKKTTPFEVVKSRCFKSNTAVEAACNKTNGNPVETVRLVIL